MQCKAECGDAFFPVLLKTSDDVPHMALIDLAVAFKDWVCRTPFVIKL